MRAASPIMRPRTRPVTRSEDLERRREVVDIVLRRDVRCRGELLTPVRCDTWSTDCHELKRGAHRRDCWLDPLRCVGLCRPCHRWVTEHPEAARETGLALRSGDPFPENDGTPHSQRRGREYGAQGAEGTTRPEPYTTTGKSARWHR